MKLLRSVLRTPIRMHYRACYGQPFLLACFYGHVKGGHDELRRHLGVDTPSQDSPATWIHECCQVSRSVGRRQVRDVRDPSPIEPTGLEIAIEQIEIHRLVVIAVRCLVRSLAVPIPNEAVASEQMLEARNVDLNPLSAQKLMELSIAGGVAEQPT